MSEHQVLIVGAGPTGLTLALWLTRLGIGVRIIDKAAEPGTTSRALAVQARTLEFDRQVGLADTLVDGGRRLDAVNLWVAGRRVARAVLGSMGAGLSPFPYALIFPQDEHERVLIERLADGGVKVERRIELLGFEQTGSRIVARLRRADGTEEICDTPYLAGCDGAHSTVRETLDVRFRAEGMSTCSTSPTWTRGAPP
jgi:2-polyprenyl-6-methoxyphenol hydroxylase-like FAD-dependent oxidoreductase